MITKEQIKQLAESGNILSAVAKLALKGLTVTEEVPVSEATTPPYPDHTPPATPEGMKWEYRGRGYETKDKVTYYCVDDRNVVSVVMTHSPAGNSSHHYFEAVPSTAPHAVENYHLKTVISDKDATLRRLTEKLENLERHVQEEHVAAWEKVQDALGSASEGCSASLCDRTVEAIRERDTLKAETERLHTLWHAAEEKCKAHARDTIQYAEFTYGIAKVLGWGTTEISLKDIVVEVQNLHSWKKQVLSIYTGWEEVDAYIRNHKDAIIGDFVHVVCLQWLKERDVLKQRLENVLATIATMR